MLDNKNDALKLWNDLIVFLKDQDLEIPTNPIQKNRVPRWFYVSEIDGELHVTNAKSNKPSCSISSTRKITRDEFIRVYPYYLKRKSGFSVSYEVTGITVNQVYNFGLMKFAEESL